MVSSISAVQWMTLRRSEGEEEGAPRLPENVHFRDGLARHGLPIFFTFTKINTFFVMVTHKALRCETRKKPSQIPTDFISVSAQNKCRSSRFHARHVHCNCAEHSMAYSQTVQKWIIMSRLIDYGKWWSSTALQSTKDVLPKGSEGGSVEILIDENDELTRCADPCVEAAYTFSFLFSE